MKLALLDIEVPMFLLDIKRKGDLSVFTATSVGASAGFLITTQLPSQFIADHPDDPTIRWLAVLPVVALVAAVVLALRSLRRMDELARKIHTEAMACAFLGSNLLIFTYGSLTMADLLTLNALWLPPAMVSCWVIWLLLAFERYR